jgi:hypothetical protein
MGRPKKNRKKAPEEKQKKNGAIYVTRAGITMHCSICRKPDHNKKGHDKYVQAQLSQELQASEEPDEGYDDPSIIQHIIHQHTDPRHDPTHARNSMVYQLGQEVPTRLVLLSPCCFAYSYAH